MLSAPPIVPTRLRHARWLPAALALLLVAAVFHPVLRAAFVNWDDPVHIYQNPYMNPLTWAGVGHFWRAPYEGLYVPVSYTVYAALAAVARLPAPAPDPSGGMTPYDPHVFHAANLLLHLANVLLVFALLRRLLGKDWPACGGAMLFGLHPLQVESVAWISELRGLLATFFGLLALGQYVQYAQASPGAGRARPLHYGLALAAFGLALLSKPSAVAVPLIAALLDWGLVRRPGRRVARALLGWAAVALPVVALTRGAQPVPAALQISLWQRPLVAGDALAFYLGKLLLPVRLAAVYDRTPAHVLQHPWVYGAWLVPAGVGALLWLGRGRCRPLLVAGGVLVAGVLPVLGFVPFIYQTFSTVADRYVYLAMLGPALAVAWLLAQARTPAVPALTVGALGVFAALSAVQVSYWRDSVALFEHTLAVAPAAASMHTDYGETLMAQGRTQQAMRQYGGALAGDPGGAVTHYDLAIVLQQSGRPEAAAAQYREAIRLKPDYAQAHCNLGQLLSSAGQAEDAEAHLRRALLLDPDLAQAHYSLGLLFADRGRTEDAVREWGRAAALWPTFPDAHYNLAVALQKTGHPAQAAAELRRYRQLRPAPPVTAPM